MKLWIYIFLTTMIWADCSSTQREDAIGLWQSSLHEKNLDKKSSLLDKAIDKGCDYDFIILDRFILKAKREIDELREEDIEALKNMKNDLKFPQKLLSLDQIDRHRFNIGKDIDNLFVQYYENQIKSNRTKSLSFENKKWQEQINRLNAPFSEQSFKAITRIGGSYKVDLLFDVGKSIIKNDNLVKRIIKVIDEEISSTPETIFGLEGGASSEGSAKLNQKLSKARANALAKEIFKKYPNYRDNIKISAMGESQLVCEGGLLPEENTKGEYECLTVEDKIKSRRVAIRIIR